MYVLIPLGGKCDPSSPLTEGTRLIPPNYLGTLGALRERPIKNKCPPISAHKLSGESHLPPNGVRHKLMRCTPMRCMLMRYTPIRCTPIRCTPIRCTPIRYMPMRCTRYE